ncbi:MAG: hypothetical protein JNL10_02040 [Verrucomicrobiales bacterium]|nr:hypothetical protein [Verrucomicrobiales bacterium]
MRAAAPLSIPWKALLPGEGLDIAGAVEGRLAGAGEGRDAVAGVPAGSVPVDGREPPPGKDEAAGRLPEPGIVAAEGADADEPHPRASRD